MDIQRFIVEHGTWSYLATFLWTFFEGETFVLVAGFAAAQGLLSAPLLLIAAWLGSFSGDQCYFWIGRHFGLRMIARHPQWGMRVDSALGWLKRYDIGFILSFRFIYGVRNFSSFALGISGIGWRRFLLLNWLAAGLWAAIFISAGYLFGDAFDHVASTFARRLSLAALAVFILVIAGTQIVLKLRRRQAEPAAPPT